MDNAQQCKTAMRDLLAMLLALHWNYWTAHWQAKGASFYADHLLFQRLYEGLVTEIDGMAEKMVGTYGAESVCGLDSIGRAHKRLAGWHAVSGSFERALVSEAEFQELLGQVRTMLDSNGALTLGLDNFLQGLADVHETNVYLLRQRLTESGQRGRYT
jgi:starvation-inducible DNA-binding protein